MAPLSRPISSQAPPTTRNRRAVVNPLNDQSTLRRKEALWAFWSSVLSNTSWFYNALIMTMSSTAATLMVYVGYSIIEQFEGITDIERGIILREIILRRQAGRRLRLLRSLLILTLLAYIVHFLLQPTGLPSWTGYQTPRHAGITLAGKSMQKVIVDGIRSAMARIHAQAHGFATTIKCLVDTMSKAMCIVRRPLLLTMHAVRGSFRVLFRKAFAPLIKLWPLIED